MTGYISMVNRNIFLYSRGLANFFYCLNAIFFLLDMRNAYVYTHYN